MNAVKKFDSYFENLQCIMECGQVLLIPIFEHLQLYNYLLSFVIVAEKKKKVSSIKTVNFTSVVDTSKIRVEFIKQLRHKAIVSLINIC